MSLSLRRYTIAVYIALAGLSHLPCSGTELVYVPVNPTFGGNPLNGIPLLNAAQATNRHKAPTESGLSGAGGLFGQQSALDQFNELLQRAILNRLASAATGSIVGADGKIIPGMVNTTDFNITIADLGNGLLQITTTDKTTGSTTSFQVSQ